MSAAIIIKRLIFAFPMDLLVQDLNQRHQFETYIINYRP